MHGPHVDARDYPDKAFVRLKVFIPSVNKEASITRKVKTPNAFKIEPEDADVVAALEEVARHPELTLTRRQIARFILAQASTRSKDIQTLLRLEAIDEGRARLKTALNTADRRTKEADAAGSAAADALRRALDIEMLQSDDVLAVNKQREVLGLDTLPKLDTTTSFTVGMASGDDAPKGPSKEAATRDLEAFQESIDRVKQDDDTASELTSKIDLLTERPGLRTALHQRSLVESGLQLADKPACPLCDTPWELDALIAHLRSKLEASKEAQVIERELKKAAQQLSTKATALYTVVDTVATLASLLELPQVAIALEQWRDDLVGFRTHLGSVDGVVESSARLRSSWQGVPSEVATHLVSLKNRVRGLPESSDKDKAIKLLIVAEERLTVFRQRRRDLDRKKRVGTLARYNVQRLLRGGRRSASRTVRDGPGELHQVVSGINRDDEGKFSAKLEPTAGKLELSVDFYERGLFPPGAYHSEGHQDGMGLCLYLALMEQLFQSDFTLAILDDVVMSVDKQHRREVCRLLKDRFPNTQFLITTHDEAWLRQMQASKLVTRTTAVMFRGWTVGDGPRVNNATDAWEEIDTYMEDERVSDAATTLRRYLEFVFGEIAECLGAATLHKPDGNYDLGDLLPSSVSRMKNHLKAGVKSAKAWENEDALKAAEERQQRFTECQTRQGDEQWVVNRAVHFNEWADFAPEEFEPVVAACRDLVACLRCEECGSWLSAIPRTSAKVLKCDCSEVTINLEMPG
jgi:hypothetical protein